MKDNPKKHEPMEYQLLTEVDLAKKYFDWSFYHKQKPDREPIKTDGDLTRYLLSIGFKCEDDENKTSIYAQEQKKKKEYAEKMSFENLTRGM